MMSQVFVVNKGGFMQIGIAPFSIGFLIALIVLLLCILAVVGVLPETPAVVFGLIGAVAVARLC